jgi:hypothetical protein
VWDDEETRQHPYPEEESAIRVIEEGRWRKARLRVVTNCKTGRPFPITGNFASNLFCYLTGRNTAEARRDFPGTRYVDAWEEWAFSELIQRRVDTSDARPTDQDWMEGWHAITQVVKCFKPRIVLGLSYRMRETLKSIGQAEVGNAEFFFVRHPSSRGLTTATCRESHNDVIERCRALTGPCPAAGGSKKRPLSQQ